MNLFTPTLRLATFTDRSRAYKGVPASVSGTL
jgi:hypothetical protein